MDESFGARLRHQREKKGVSLRTIANQTKIKLSLLEGLERDDIRQWPAGIFRRAFVRDYAHAIGLDPDAVVREFVERYPAPIEVPEPPPPAPSRLRSLVESALGSFRAVSPQGNAGAAAGGGPWFGPAPSGDAIGEPGFGPVSSGAGSGDSAAHAASPSDRVPFGDPPFTITADLSQAIPNPVVSPVVSRAVDRRTSHVARRTSDARRRSQDGGAPDLLAAARICTELGRVEHTRQVPPLLREAAGLLGAKGLIVWVWDALSQELKPAMALGYPSRVLSQLGGLSRDADNAAADAFRSAEARAIGGALVVPLLTPAACAGVLAIELSNASRPAPPVMAIATILAAMLAQLIGTDSEPT